MATVRFSIVAMRVIMVAERLAEDWLTMADMSVKEEVGSNQVVWSGKGSLSDEVEIDASYESVCLAKTGKHTYLKGCLGVKGLLA